MLNSGSLHIYLQRDHAPSKENYTNAAWKQLNLIELSLEKLREETK